jgi:DNA-binding XRE family transcriptional regulator
LTLWRGNFEPIIVPFEAFPATANGIRPDFAKFAVIDYGQTLKFGEYESDVEPVLFEYAPDFRRELKQRRFRDEQTLGASIRRLRKMRRLTRHDFEGVNPKTLARIEHGETQPRSETLARIADTLQVPVDELGNY